MRDIVAKGSSSHDAAMQSTYTTSPRGNLLYQLPLIALILTSFSCSEDKGGTEPVKAAKTARTAEAEAAAPLHDPRETHLANILQLTFGGENAEGYFDSKAKRMVFQARRGKWGFDCDQIFEMDLDTLKTRRISTGKGRTTCAFYLEGDERILFSSTHLDSLDCPTEPDHSQGYVWPIYASYDIFIAQRDDPTKLTRLTKSEGYDAEATVCAATGRIIFTSTRDGDLELYSMKDDGTDVKRLTNSVGYDGGGFFSPDGKQIVWRANHPSNAQEEADYKRLLGNGLVRPTKMEIWVADADGSNARQITKNGKANFCPCFFPDGKRVIFAANLEGPRNFHLYTMNTDGSGLERVTYSSGFNAFAMFSADGKKLIFASNRHNAKRGETNLFIADWVSDGP